MDGQRFDNMARACASTYSRRGALRVLLGGAAGGTLGLLRRGATAHHNPGHCRAVGEACNRNHPCCPSPYPCVEHVCLPTGNDDEWQCIARPRPANTACPEDGNLCTADVCDGQGACVHPLAVTCDPPDQCHAPGICNPATGACDYEPLADNTRCDSGNLCTRDDTCQAGVCVPGAERLCALGHVCADVRCNPASGDCDLLIPVADGSSCQSGDLCRPNGSCHAGECFPGEPVVCEPLDDCHDPGVCDSGTGECSNPTKQDGSYCPLDDLCYQVTTCQAGVCVGEMRLVCQTANPCLVGACDPASGFCEYINAPFGTACDDGDPCTVNDVCTSGVCGGTLTVCTPTDCQVSSVCDGAGGCVVTNRPDGTSCGAGRVCFGGTCCTPTTCSGRCGIVSNSCGGTLDCGTCGGSGCFVAGTRVAMADGTSKTIELVEVGDRVLGRDGRVNRVLGLARPLLGNRPLFALNGGSPFVTASHPFLTTAGWKAVDPVAAARDVPGLPVGRLEVGDRLLALVPSAVAALVGGPQDQGEMRPALVPLERLDGRNADPATQLFNLRVDGDHTYFANDLLVHNKEGGG